MVIRHLLEANLMDHQVLPPELPLVDPIKSYTPFHSALALNSLAMKFVMSKAMVAVIIVASVCILRVLKTTTTNTGVKLSAIFVKTWTITLP